MKNQLSKLSILLLGFVAGIAFLISCGGSDGTSISLPGLPINDADAGALPVISDQMYCAGTATPIDQASSTPQLSCMKQSTQVSESFNSLAGVFAEGWIMVQLAGPPGGAGVSAMYLFYK